MSTKKAKILNDIHTTNIVDIAKDAWYLLIKESALAEQQSVN